MYCDFKERILPPGFRFLSLIYTRRYMLLYINSLVFVFNTYTSILKIFFISYFYQISLILFFTYLISFRYVFCIQSNRHQSVVSCSSIWSNTYCCYQSENILLFDVWMNFVVMFNLISKKQKNQTRFVVYVFHNVKF